MRAALVGLVVLATATAGAGERSIGAVRPIRGKDLKAVVRGTTLDTLRADEPRIPGHKFEQKMQFALGSPLLLKETFPGLLGAMVRDLVGTRALPGAIVPIGFDAHIENAGVVRLGKDAQGKKRSIATLIDFDDSGVGPAGVDALSIGTALRQGGFNKKVMDRAYAAFAEAATSEHQGPIEVDGPKWGKLRRGWLAKNTTETSRDGKRVLSFVGMERAKPGDYRAIERAASQDGVLRGYDVLDVARHDKVGGGSGGLTEFLVLAQRKRADKVDVFLFKEQESPGASQLGLAQPSDATRLAVLEKGLWHDAPNDVFFYARNVKLPGVPKMDFLVRNKFSMVGDVAVGKHADETAIQVARLYGREHAGQFGDLSEKELAKWMKHSTEAVVTGFDQLHQKLKADFKDWRPADLH